MWHGPMNHGYSCFGLMLGFGYGPDPMMLLTPVVNKAYLQAGGDSIMLCGVFTGLPKQGIDR